MNAVDHAEFFHQVPDEYLADILPLARKCALASGLGEGQYNLLQVRRVSETLIRLHANPAGLEQWPHGSSGNNAATYISITAQ